MPNTNLDQQQDATIEVEDFPRARPRFVSEDGLREGRDPSPRDAER